MRHAPATGAWCAIIYRYPLFMRVIEGCHLLPSPQALHYRGHTHNPIYKMVADVQKVLRQRRGKVKFKKEALPRVSALAPITFLYTLGHILIVAQAPDQFSRRLCPPVLFYRSILNSEWHPRISPTGIRGFWRLQPRYNTPNMCSRDATSLSWYAIHLIAFPGTTPAFTREAFF